MRQDHQVRRREAAEETGLVYDIPTEYNIVFPFTEMSTVKDFAANLTVNNLKHEDGRERNRRHELVRSI